MCSKNPSFYKSQTEIIRGKKKSWDFEAGSLAQTGSKIVRSEVANEVEKCLSHKLRWGVTKIIPSSGTPMLICRKKFSRCVFELQLYCAQVKTLSAQLSVLSTKFFVLLLMYVSR